MMRRYPWAWLGAALLCAVGAGFGLARLLPDPRQPLAHATSHDADAGSDNHNGAPDARASAADAPDIVLTARQIRASGIGIVAATRGGGQGARLSGRVEPALGAQADVGAAVSGQVQAVLVAPGEAVQAGQALLVIVGGDAALLRASAEAANAEAEAARLGLQRDQSLVAQGVVARQDLEASRARALATAANARATRARRDAAGRVDGRGRLTVVSPLAGVVGAITVTPGAFVNAGDPVARVADAASIELVFHAPPALAAQLRPGTRIEASDMAGSFGATIIGTANDARAAGGLAVVRARADAGASPAAGTPVAAMVVADASATAISVPADAVQVVAGASVVFVASDAGFRVRPVLPGRQAGGQVEILKGLAGGERIAATNAFLLKAELAKHDADHGH